MITFRFLIKGDKGQIRPRDRAFQLETSKRLRGNVVLSPAETRVFNAPISLDGTSGENELMLSFTEKVRCVVTSREGQTLTLAPTSFLLLPNIETVSITNTSTRNNLTKFLWSWTEGGVVCRLLLEDDSFLLLETGDRLALENCDVYVLLLETGDRLLYENGDRVQL